MFSRPEGFCVTWAILVHFKIISCHMNHRSKLSRSNRASHWKLIWVKYIFLAGSFIKWRTKNSQDTNLPKNRGARTQTYPKAGVPGHKPTQKQGCQDTNLPQNRGVRTHTCVTGAWQWCRTQTCVGVRLYFAARKPTTEDQIGGRTSGQPVNCVMPTIVVCLALSRQNTERPPTPPVGSQHSCQPTVKTLYHPLVWIFSSGKGVVWRHRGQQLGFACLYTSTFASSRAIKE